MAILEDISLNLQRGKAKVVKELVQQAIDKGIDAKEILEAGAARRHEHCGREVQEQRGLRSRGAGGRPRHEHGRVDPQAPAGQRRRRGQGHASCIGTVKGDLHDIGKNLVKMMMEGKGLEGHRPGRGRLLPRTSSRPPRSRTARVICLLRAADHHHGRHGATWWQGS